MNPAEAMFTLCERFLDQHQGQERVYELDQIAERINNQPGWDAPYPTTARALINKIYGLLDASGKHERLAWLLDGMDREDLDGETLEGMAASLED